MERCYLGIVVGRRSRTLQNVGGPWIPTDQRSLCPSIVELIDRTAILSLCYRRDVSVSGRPIMSSSLGRCIGLQLRPDSRHDPRGRSHTSQESFSPIWFTHKQLRRVRMSLYIPCRYTLSGAQQHLRPSPKETTVYRLQ